MSSRTVSIRLSSELIQRIDERCNTDGCCRNDFVKNAINEALKEKNKPIPVMKVKRVSYDDGKTWIDLK